LWLCQIIVKNSQKCKNTAKKEELKELFFWQPRGLTNALRKPLKRFAEVISWLKTDTRLANLEVKEFVCDYLPFQRLKISLKTGNCDFWVNPKVILLKQQFISKCEEWNQLLKLWTW